MCSPIKVRRSPVIHHLCRNMQDWCIEYEYVLSYAPEETQYLLGCTHEQAERALAKARRIYRKLRLIDEQRTETCPVCSGTGMHSDDTCPMCEGTGAITPEELKEYDEHMS